MKYRVTITRTEPRSHDFVVEADDAFSARAEAHLDAADFDFGSAVSGEPEYTVTDLEKLTSTFEVIVGNIGTVYSGHSQKEALDNYREYKKQSMDNYGRAAREPVCLFKNGEPVRQHAGLIIREIEL
jgi:hypothetical protein